MKTIELIENDRTAGPRFRWRMMNGPYEIPLEYPYSNTEKGPIIVVNDLL
jgi:hypothetical protein